jgi:hypothetical protein
MSVRVNIHTIIFHTQYILVALRIMQSFVPVADNITVTGIFL